MRKLEEVKLNNGNIITMKCKETDGIKLYFYPGLGWVSRERLSQPDVTVAEEVKDFLHNKDNICNCAECPYNGSADGGKYPCGQQTCWVEVHCC